MGRRPLRTGSPHTSPLSVLTLCATSLCPPPPLCLLAPQAIEFNLFEEAFEIYKKFGKKVNAIQVLLNNLQDLDRAHEYANKVSQAAVRLSQALQHA